VTLSTLRFHKNDIHDIHPGAFEVLRGLKILMITSERLKYLSSLIYRGLNDLEMLILDNNDINFNIYSQCNLTENVEDIPIVLPKLKWFSLAGNPLTIVPEQMWAGLRRSPLNTIDLKSCALEDIHPGMDILYF